MKRNKIIILITIVLAISILSTGCGEKVSEQPLDNNVKVSTKDDNIPIIDKDDDDYEAISNLDWPADKMKPLPTPEAEVLYITEPEYEDSITVVLNFPNLKAVQDYVEQVKALGYVGHTLIEGGEIFSFGGAFKDDNSVFDLIYQEYDDSTTITLSRDTSYSVQYFEPDEDIEMDLANVDMTDEIPWPKEQMDKFPELEGKIKRGNISNESVYMELDYVKKDDFLSYIETAKNLGFDVITNQKKFKNIITFIGENDKEQTISLAWEKGFSTINYIKNK